MKRTSKENVEHNEYLDGKLVRTELMKNRAIYKNAAGAEHIRYVHGYRMLRRDRWGVLVWDHFCKTIQPINIFDVLKRVKETGGTVTVLPPNGLLDSDTDQEPESSQENDEVPAKELQ